MTSNRSTSDSTQLGVFDARARSSDPVTSKAAAASVANVRASHKRVLAMFRAYGDMTDETLAEYLNEASVQTGLKLMSPSGVRSRRNELSKPNMDRLDQLASDLTNDGNRYGEVPPDMQRWARAALLVGGIKSPLWDTGKREKLASGRQAIVWGIAK